MTIDVTKLGEELTFEIHTESLGKIRCQPLNGERQLKFSKVPKSVTGSARYITLLMLVTLGERMDSTAPQDRTISLAQAEALRDEELETFAKTFLEKNRWLVGKRDLPRKVTEGQGNSSNVEQLHRVLVEYDKQLTETDRKATSNLDKNLLREQAKIANYLNESRLITEAAGAPVSNPAADFHKNLLLQQPSIANQIQMFVDAARPAFDNPASRLQNDLLKFQTIADRNMHDMAGAFDADREFRRIADLTKAAIEIPLPNMYGMAAAFDVDREFRRIADLTKAAIEIPLPNIPEDMVKQFGVTAGGMRNVLSILDASRDFRTIAEAAATALTSPLAKIGEDLFRQRGLIETDFRAAVGALDTVADQFRMIAEAASISRTMLGALGSVYENPPELWSWMPNHLRNSLVSLDIVTSDLSALGIYSAVEDATSADLGGLQVSIPRGLFRKINRAVGILKSWLDREQGREIREDATGHPAGSKSLIDRMALVVEIALLVTHVVCHRLDMAESEQLKATSREQTKAIQKLTDEMEAQRNQFGELLTRLLKKDGIDGEAGSLSRPKLPRKHHKNRTSARRRRR